MRFDQRRRSASSLHEASGLNEVPAFAVAERRISDALKEMRTFLDAAKEKMLITSTGNQFLTMVFVHAQLHEALADRCAVKEFS